MKLIDLSDLRYQLININVDDAMKLSVTLYLPLWVSSHCLLKTMNSIHLSQVNISFCPGGLKLVTFTVD